MQDTSRKEQVGGERREVNHRGTERFYILFKWKGSQPIKAGDGGRGGIGGIGGFSGSASLIKLDESLEKKSVIVKTYTGLQGPNGNNGNGGSGGQSGCMYQCSLWWHLRTCWRRWLLKWRTKCDRPNYWSHDLGQMSTECITIHSHGNTPYQINVEGRSTPIPNTLDIDKHSKVILNDYKINLFKNGYENFYPSFYNALNTTIQV